MSFLLVFFVPFALALFLLWMDRLEIKVLHPHGIPEENNAAAEITDLPLTSADAETPDPAGDAKNFYLRTENNPTFLVPPQRTPNPTMKRITRDNSKISPPFSTQTPHFVTNPF
ncbi:hypothetical protein EU799_06475 [Corynebacterium silvaticum]|uniref:hypothetical protein n=1 Tax=Corynebacterium silvaticum TaxID=2320431 RepID=UPI001067AB2E|nr:hypothetical protein [Corynebacterium silvaticum]MBH5299955.1 hypothetical protein [Corynebacterium silvaticum]NOM65521.1 hypothetical protein [Corynebacterium silvaticum]TFA92283.1 hypothetical protein EU802_06295 [Corynebacterium silvaticum]TFA96162.1 hypothetical protein EU799_06475 [Corynebacterium silvaticum]TNX79637.1 hypothetical protein FIT55_09085 [Corynebacterium silvaticum]